jgi:lysocardiolipin and lysophospholipid acyltransferase
MSVDKKSIAHMLRAIVSLNIMFWTSAIGSMFMLFPYLPLKFLNRKVFTAFTDFSIQLWFGLTVFLLEKICQIQICVHSSKKNKNNNKTKLSDINGGTIVVMNHRTRLDWLFYFCVLYRIGKLRDIKIILKESLKFIPGAGWAMQTALFIFIKRKWEVDRDIFTKLISYYKLIEKKVFILIFPEGTDFTASSKAKSDSFALKNNVLPYEQVLHPRVTGFIHIYNEMARMDSLDFVHDVTIAYDNNVIPANELDFVRGNLPHRIHFFIEEFQCKDIIPPNIEGGNKEIEKKMLEDWLIERWRLKEEFLVK